MTQTNPNLSPYGRKRLLNVQLSILPTFMPLNDWRVHRINRTTSLTLLHYLIDLARKTIKYTIDTEHDYYTHEASLIQIEFIRRQSVILLFETCHLPQTGTTTFWLIQSLFTAILNSSHVIYSWGNAVHELGRFIRYDLFSWSTLHQMNTVDVQCNFKIWYNTVFLHDCSLDPFEDDHNLCTCSHRPIKYRKNQWSLQKAIAYTFHEFLDKSQTNNQWRRRLANNDGVQEEISDESIRYAVNDCLAVTKLRMLTDFNWTKEQLDTYNRNK